MIAINTELGFQVMDYWVVELEVADAAWAGCAVLTVPRRRSR